MRSAADGANDGRLSQTTKPWTTMPMLQPSRAHTDHQAFHSPAVPAEMLVTRFTASMMNMPVANPPTWPWNARS